MKVKQVLAGAAATGVALVLLGGTASAHVVIEQQEAPAGGYSLITLDVGHGCDESPTTQLAVQLPEGTTSATPQELPGWTAEVTVSQLDEPLEVPHGEPITEGPTEVTWTATGEGLAPDRLERFTMSVGMPAGEPGDIAYFPTVQTCAEGENAWIESWDGEGEEPESPSPSIHLVSEEGGHGAETEEAEGPEGSDSGDTEMASADAPSQDDVDTARTIAVVGVVVGLIGVIVAIAALLKGRKPDAA